MKKIYFDYNATTPMRPEVLQAMLPYLQMETELYANPSSTHELGQKSRAALDKARAQVAQVIGASVDEIVFTSCGSESDTLAIKGAAYAAQERGRGRHLLTTEIEHDTVLFCFEYLRTQGWDITLLPVNSNGVVDPSVLKKALRADTALVSVMHANNETGVIQPIAEIGEICKMRDIIFHTDAIQTVGKIPVNVEELNVDLLSFSAHKFYGPKGVGGLYIRKGTRLHPLFHGHHEKNRRAGTENVAGIVGCGKALELAAQEMQAETSRLAQLRDQLENGIISKVAYAHVNGKHAPRIPSTSNISFEYIEGEGCLVMLDIEGIALSTGSACASGTTQPSHVLRAMGIEGNIAQGTVRFSLGHYNSQQDVDRALEIVPQVIDRLREFSPLWADFKSGTKTDLTSPFCNQPKPE